MQQALIVFCGNTVHSNHRDSAALTVQFPVAGANFPPSNCREMFGEIYTQCNNFPVTSLQGSYRLVTNLSL